MMTTTLTLLLGKPAMEHTPSCSLRFGALIGFKPGDFMTIGKEASCVGITAFQTE
jgi:hypothetical protein